MNAFAAGIHRECQRASNWLISLARDTWQHIRALAAMLGRWHARQLAAEPSYGLALTATGEMLVHLLVPSRTLANVLLRLLSDVADVRKQSARYAGHQSGFDNPAALGWNDPWGND